MTIYFEGSAFIDVIVDDKSYRYRRIMGENVVYLHFSLPIHSEIPVGSYIEYEGQTYSLKAPAKVVKYNNRNFEYVADFQSAAYNLFNYKLRNTVDGRLKFPFTARPQEHLQLLVDNMNTREIGWSVGDYLPFSEKLVSYNHDYIGDALIKIAEAFQTEFEIVGKVINLKKVEHAKNNPLPLSYGMGNGLLSGTGRANFGEGNPIEVLYVQGGERNIDFATYGNKELLLPLNQTIKYDGEFFEGESGYNIGNAKEYVVDPQGLYIKRNDKPLTHRHEDSLDLTSFYPSREGAVSSVIAVNPSSNLYDFTDNSVPASLDFNDCLIAGQNMTVLFQSGMLSGREFEISQYLHPTRRFKLVPAALDGIDMPNPTWLPAFGDKYVALNIMLPSSYIRDDSTKTGASWDMFRQAVRYLYDNEEQRFTVTGEVDSIWSKKNWLNIGGRLQLGYFVRFSDPQILPSGADIRIVGIKDYLNNPQKPKIELTNNSITGGVSSTIKQLEATEVVIDEAERQSIAFTKRRYRDAVETMKLIELTMSEYFTAAINPAAVHTMSLLVGHDSLQFRFVNNKTAPIEVIHTVTYNNDTKILYTPAGIIQHMTIGITDISSSHKVEDYLFWDMPEFTSPPLVDPTKAYWLYARVPKTSGTGEFRLSDVPLDFDSGSVYNLWVGVLNTEYLDERSYVDLYGFTEILPGRITTKRIVSEDGLNWFDFVANSVRIGNETVFLDWNNSIEDALHIRGVIVQSPSGAEDVIGVFIGTYDPMREYFRGDIVEFTDFDGNKARYKYINTISSQGNLPTDVDYWKIDSEDGKRGRVLTNVGLYDNDYVYKGNDIVAEAVKYGLMWYMTRPNAGEFSGIPPSGSGNEKWMVFGANLKSVATDLLLADKAAIGNWWIEGGSIVSRLLDESGETYEEPRMSLDANEVEIRLTQGGNDFPNTTILNKNGVVVQNGNYIIIEGDDGSGHRPFAESAISGFAKGNVNRASSSEPTGASFVAGVFGSAFNSGTAPAFGGVFEGLLAMGLNLTSLRITSGGTYTLNNTSVFVSAYSSCTINLPVAPYSGKVILIRLNSAISVTVNGNGVQILPPASGAVNNITVSTRGELLIIIFDGTYWIHSTTAQ